MNKQTSAGVLITDGTSMLACHPTGKKELKGFYDIPKGRVEEGESPLEAAIREVYEETGLELDPDDLGDYGLFEYNEFKDIYLFVYIMDELPDLGSLTCESKFELFGRMVPEMNGYKYVEDVSWFYPKLRPILAKVTEDLF